MVEQKIHYSLVNSLVSCFSTTPIQLQAPTMSACTPLYVASGDHQKALFYAADKSLGQQSSQLTRFQFSRECCRSRFENSLLHLITIFYYSHG